MANAEGAGAGGKRASSIVRKPVTLPQNPLPVQKAKTPSSYYTQYKKITSYQPTRSRAPVVKPVAKSTPTVQKSTSSSGGSSKSGGGGGGSSSGGSSGGSALTSVVSAYDPMKDPTYLASMAKLNDLWGQAGNYKTQIDDLMKNGFTYDPTTDAAYKSLQDLATKNAKTASNEALETMNDRGILNSTVTSDRLGQIEQTAQDAVTAQVPTLQNAAYSKYMDKLSTLNNLWNSTVAQAQQERSFGEDKRRWELGYQLDKDQFNTSKNQWQQTFNYNASQDAINNAFKNQQLQLDQLNYDLDYLSSIQNSIGVNNKQATNAAIADLLGYKSKADVIKRLRSKVSDWYSGGVNFSEVLTAMNKYYPGIETEAKKSISFKS